MAESLRILLVEDEDEWYQALHDGVQAVAAAAGQSPEIVRARNQYEAEARLEEGQFDGMLLDINLRKGVDPEVESPDEYVRGANGIEVLMRAGKKRFVSGVLIVTGIRTDATFPIVLEPDKERGKEDVYVATLSKIASKLFGERRACCLEKLAKERGVSPTRQVEMWVRSGQIIWQVLESMFSQPSYRVPAPYKLTVSGTIQETGQLDNGVARIESLKLSSADPVVFSGAQSRWATFLYHIARAKKLRPDGVLRQDEIEDGCRVGLFSGKMRKGGQRSAAEMAIQGLRRALSKRGVDVNRLLETCAGHGIRLNEREENVLLQGVSCVKPPYKLIVPRPESHVARVVVIRNASRGPGRKPKRELLLEGPESTDASLLSWMARAADEGLEVRAGRVAELLGINDANADSKQSLVDHARAAISRLGSRLLNHPQPVDAGNLLSEGGPTDQPFWALSAEVIWASSPGPTKGETSENRPPERWVGGGDPGAKISLDDFERVYRGLDGDPRDLAFLIYCHQGIDSYETFLTVFGQSRKREKAISDALRECGGRWKEEQVEALLAQIKTFLFRRASGDPGEGATI